VPRLKIIAQNKDFLEDSLNFSDFIASGNKKGGAGKSNFLIE
jgi:hypothetical protein